MELETKQARETRQIELVETSNLTRSLRRLQNVSPYSPKAWKRALYHALSMSGVSHDAEIQKLRELLGLP